MNCTVSTPSLTSRPIRAGTDDGALSASTSNRPTSLREPDSVIARPSNEPLTTDSRSGHRERGGIITMLSVISVISVASGILNNDFERTTGIFDQGNHRCNPD